MRRIGLVLWVVLWLGGCAGTPETAKPINLPNLDRPINVRVLWRHPGSESPDSAFQPAVDGRAVYVADGSGQIRRLQIADNGDTVVEKWRSERFRRLSGGVAVSSAIVVVGTINGEVIALSTEDGKVRWRTPISAEVIAPAVISEGMVVVRSGDNRLHGFDEATGRRKWTYQRAIPALSVRTLAAPVIADQLAIAGFPGGKVVAVNIHTGAAMWEGTVSQPKGSNELERISDVVAAPVIGARELCAVAHQGRLACFDLNRGDLLWTKEVSSAVGLSLDNRSVYVTDDKGVVHAFDRTSGGALWKQDKLINRPVGVPLVRRGHILVTDGLGFVHALSREDGALVGRIEIGGGRVDVPMVSVGDGALVQTSGGQLVAVQAE